MAFTQRNMAAGGPGKGSLSAVSNAMSNKAKQNSTKTATKSTGKVTSTKVTTLPEIKITAKKTTPVKILPEIKVTAKKKFAEPYKYFIGKEVGGKTDMVSKAQYEAHKGVKTRMQTDASGNPVEGGSGGKVYTNYNKKVKKKM